jgi:hypothetical protein
LTDGRSTPYAATLLGNLKHCIKDDPEIFRLIEELPAIIRQKLSVGNNLGEQGISKGKVILIPQAAK